MHKKSVLFVVVMLFVCIASSAWSETMTVSTQQVACNGRLSIVSETGLTGYDLGSSSNFDVNVGLVSRIVSATISWKAGLSGSMCLVYCQLYVNGVKHTNGRFAIYNWTTSGPQYVFDNINGSKTGTQSLTCVRDNSMTYLPRTYGEFPLP